MGGSRSGRYGSGRPIAAAFRPGRVHTPEGNRLPVVGDVAEMKVGSIVARLRFTETATRFGGRRLWMLCPRCSRRCRVLFIGFGRVACRRCFRLRYQSQSLDQMDRAPHVMGKIARQIDPQAGMDLPDSLYSLRQSRRLSGRPWAMARATPWARTTAPSQRSPRRVP